MKDLIVTADDFGAATEVNEAVAAAHRDGVLTAASLMVGAPAAGEAVRIARAMPGLRVGLHLVLVEGRPVLPASQVDRLVDGSGRFRSDMAALGVTLAFDPRARRQLAAEIAAQFDAFALTGLTLDHVNAHKHFHLHPAVAAQIVKAGARHGLAAVRVPVEPPSVLKQVEPETAFAFQPVTTTWAGLTRRRMRRAGMLVPDRVFGLRWSGAMRPSRLAGLICALPEGLTEIYLHPATRCGFDGAAPGYGYAEELAALVSPETAQAVRNAGVRLGGYADFASRAAL